ncbi:MAG: AMP-binding protein, partial [Planctomycetaceae bacterium]|nr:AMP-binding protein [Planctomycetaceae bacterium]
RHHAVQPDDTAFFSLTSGSTGASKCIDLTHRALLARARGANQLCDHRASDVILSWLPFDHIGSMSDWHLRCVVARCQMVYAAKSDILPQPLRWLELIDRFRVTHTWAPNFAYSLVLDALAGRDTHSWNLSCMAAFLTAGENVSPVTARRFLERLAPCGLVSTAIRPAFGMAETGSGITYRCATADEPLRVKYVERASTSGTLVPAASDDPSAIGFVALGPPIPGVELRLVDAAGQVVPQETVGQLQVRGAALARGYYRNDEANVVFRADGWFDTGDLGFIADGELYLTGRAKETIIIHGANLSCAEIEEVTQSIAGVEPSYTAACAVRIGVEPEALAIFFHTKLDDPAELVPLLKEIRREVVRQVGVNPRYLLPVSRESIPKTAIGKIQRRQLRDQFERGDFAEIVELVDGWLQAATPTTSAAPPQNEIERQIAEIWQTALGLDGVSVQQNIFELGAHSLLLVQVHSRLEAAFNRQLSIVEMFKYPTIRELAKFLSGEVDTAGPAEQGRARAAARSQTASRSGPADNSSPPAVAVIGMACRYPGAENVAQFWHNLCHGVESISRFSDAEILAAGVDPERVRDPRYVKAGPTLPGIEQFDAEFFGISAREAELLDPQQRLFLECAWEAMEDSGHNLRVHPGSVGVFAGALLNTYF